MRILVVDAFDSFVYILRQYLLSLGAEPIVVRSNEADAEMAAVLEPDGILLGPGPGHPADSGHVELVQACAGVIPIFGVCLGHQAIGLAFGAQVRRAHRLMHGKASRIDHDGTGLFRGLPQSFTATRYHSLAVDGIPDTLTISARTADDGEVMGLRHRDLPIESVQFHPESECTEHGLALVHNFISQCERWAGPREHAAAA